MSNLTTLPVISYSWSQAAGDLTQIAPIAIVTVALLVAIVADLMLPLKARGPAVAVLSAVALAAALVVAWVEMARGGGHLAYHGYVSGDDFALLRLLFCGIRNNDAATNAFALFHAANQNPVMQRCKRCFRHCSTSP